MSIATVAAQQTSLDSRLVTAAKTAASGTATTAGADAGKAASTSLSGNFQTFLKMLMTQLQNQDPTNPLDTNQFTSQLVQFSSVEQQIATNTSLNSLIELTQSAGVLQSSTMVGRQVAVASDHLALQNGSAALQFTAPAAGKVGIAVLREDGVQVTTALVDAVRGVNDWRWNGSAADGTRAADGAYRVAVAAVNADGTTQVLDTVTIGTATGVQQKDKILQLQLGALTVPFSKVRSVLN